MRPRALQPEFLSDVQQCSKAVYLRSQEAAQCGVHSVLLLPIFGEAGRQAPIGVLEVVQSSRSKSWGNVVHALASAIEVRPTPWVIWELRKLDASPGRAATGPQPLTAHRLWRLQCVLVSPNAMKTSCS